MALLAENNSAEEVRAFDAPDYRVAWVQRLPYPLRNALGRWRGTAGMIVGVGIVLGIVMTLSALGRSLIAAYTDDFRQSAANLYVVTKGGKLVQFVPSDTPGTIENASTRLTRIRRLTGVRAAIGVLSWTVVRGQQSPRHRDELAELMAVVGVDGDPTTIPRAVDLKAGRWIERPNEIVVGWKFSREKQINLGDTVRLNGHDFAVVGIGKLRGVGFGANGVAYLDLDTLRDHADVGDVLTAILVDADQPEVVRGRIENLGSLSVLTPADLVDQAEQAAESEQVMYQVFNGLSLVVGALFVTSMLGRSVTQRRAEFATLRAIGVPTRTILVAVAGEAFLICLMAGLAGVGISLAFGTIVLNGMLAPAYGLDFVYAADEWTFAQALLVALLLGLLAGFFPARNAARVDPVEVLREV